MIELRWQQRTVDGCVQVFRVLQYRYHTGAVFGTDNNVLRYATEAEQWSDWRDVPTVTEDEK